MTDESECARDDCVTLDRWLHVTRMLQLYMSRAFDAHSVKMNPARWRILIRLRDGSLPQRALGDPLLLDAPIVSRAVESLVSDGLVSRRVGPNDARQRIVELSPEGAALAARLAAWSSAEEGRLFAGLDDADIAGLHAVLDRLDASLRHLLEATKTGRTVRREIR